MTSVTAVEPPWEGALAWKIDRSEDDRAARYEIDEVGPWTSEPDKVQWVDPSTDLDCLIVRNHFGSLCGYVGVPAGHPAYEVEDYDTVPVDVHGGLTFAGKCSPSEGPEDEPSAGICHVPFPGRPHEVFWLGFDCGHASDYQPGMASMERRIMPDLADRPYAEILRASRTASAFGFETRYRALPYVRAEVSGLASQLAVLPLVKP